MTFPATDADSNTPRHPYAAEHTESDNTFIAVLIGVLSALFVLTAVLIVALLVRRRQKHKKYSGAGGSPLKLFIGHDHVNFHIQDSSNGVTSSGGKYNNGGVYRGVASDDSDSYGKDDSLTKLTSSINKETVMYTGDVMMQGRKLPSPPCREAEVAEYASTDVTNFPNLVVNLPAAPVFKASASREETPPPQPPPPQPHAMCAAMGSSPDLNIQVINLFDNNCS